MSRHFRGLSTLVRAGLLRLGNCTRPVIFLIVCGFLIAAASAAALLFFGCFSRSRVQVSVHFLGHTNAWHAQAFERQSGVERPFSSAVSIYTGDGSRVAVLQVSNASPFSIIGHRSPEIIFDLATARSDYVPTGWRVLQPGECEQLWLEPPTKRVRWRLAIVCERFGGDSYGAGPPDFRARVRRTAIWLRDRLHLMRIPEPSQPPVVQFYSDWIEP